VTKRSLLPAALALLGIAAPVRAQDRPIVRAADVRVVFRSPTACDLTVTYTVNGAPAAGLDHRLLLYDGSGVSDVQVSGAGTADAAVPIGRSQSLVVTTGGSDGPYRIAYRVSQPEGWRFRCPIWLPAAPTEPGPGGVRIRVELPPGATPLGDSFPLFDWSGGAGAATLGNVPSLIRAPFAMPGQEVSWLERRGVIRLVDFAALGVVILATGAWALARRRR